MMFQLVSLAGAVMILVAYAGLQGGWMDRRRAMYNALNFLGSALLAWVAIADRRVGFILLEAMWALLSVPPLIAIARARSKAT